MKLARYWVREMRPHSSGKNDRQAGCWGWSEDEPSEAQQMSLRRSERLAAWLDAIGRGEDANLELEADYYERPLREEILQEFDDHEGETLAAVTRNRYGALVLNTERLVFLDRDIPQVSPRLVDCLPRWIRRGLGVSDPVSAEQNEARVLQSIREWARARPRDSFRVYRTAMGFRVVLTNRAITTVDSEAARLLEGCDPLYAQLCWEQECYRARLTPKPWRLNLTRPPKVWPFEDESAERAFRQWLSDYEAARMKSVVCHLVDCLGPGDVLEEHLPFITLHDTVTGVGRDGVLA